MSSAKWQRLVRFISEGKEFYGNASKSLKEAQVITGNPFSTKYSIGETKKIDRLVSPIARKHCRTIRGLGLNFRKHAAETGLAEPKYPVVFNKPCTALNGPYNVVNVPLMAQDGGKVDYEVELVVVIGKPCYQVSSAEALQYVAGYTVGNDVSQRTWQMEKGGSQWNIGKGFDGWAPIGPQIVSKDLIPNIGEAVLESHVNGEKRQSEKLSDMIFSVGDAIEFLSAGQTLLPGDLLFMGTPSGVGMGFKPPKWIKNGDVVECSISGIGAIRNKFVYQDSKAKL